MHIVRAFLLLVVFAGIGTGARANVAEKLSRLHTGMTKSEVVAALGDPVAELKSPNAADRYSLIYRLSFMPGAKEEFHGQSTLISIGRVRCDFQSDVVMHIAGFWPDPVRPAAGTPKEAVMLVDVAQVYDHLALTLAYNAAILKARDVCLRRVEELQKQLTMLDAAHDEQLTLAKKAKAGGEQRREAQKKAAEIMAQRESVYDACTKYIDTAQKELKARLAKYVDIRLPQIADALLEYQREHHFKYVFEIHQNIFAIGTKPIFVGGVDATNDVVKWIDAGGARDLGLIATTGD